MHWFFKPPEKLTADEYEQKALSKARKANKAVFARIGFRYIFERLIEMRTFEGLGKTPLESVRLAPFEDVLAALSINNAMKE